MNKKILLIVEGESDEKKFVRKLFKTLNNLIEYKVYSYNTNIHIMSQELSEKYSDFDRDNIDIQSFLASLTTDNEKRRLLQDYYSDIYMIFDFDPHHPQPHFDTVQRMMKYFNDSTNQGKLFINYPMMQSYKHFDILPCSDFENTLIKFEECKGYKELVGKISSYKDLSKYTYNLFVSIAVHQLKKANKIFKNSFTLPKMEEYLNIDYVKIYKCQFKCLKEQNFIYVLNTCIFMLIDYAPSKFFNYISKHGNDLQI